MIACCAHSGICWASTYGDSSESGLVATIREVAVERVRPKAATVAVIIAGLAPILRGTYSEVMSRIVTPMVGGCSLRPWLSPCLIPASIACCAADISQL